MTKGLLLTCLEVGNDKAVLSIDRSMERRGPRAENSSWKVRAAVAV